MGKCCSKDTERRPFTEEGGSPPLSPVVSREAGPGLASEEAAAKAAIEEAAASKLDAIKAATEEDAKKKPLKVLSRSNITLEILPNGSDVDMDALVARLKVIRKDGMTWGESRLEPVAFGIQKLLLAIQIEDAKISAADIEKAVMAVNEGKEEGEGDVQSVEIATWQPVAEVSPGK